MKIQTNLTSSYVWNFSFLKRNYCIQNYIFMNHFKENQIIEKKTTENDYIISDNMYKFKS